MANGFINSAGGKTVMFQGTKKGYVKFAETDYSVSTSTAGESPGYFHLLNDKGREIAFQIVMPSSGKMKVLGKHESPGEEGMLYFSEGENSFLVKRVYFVSNNASDEFYYTY
jgi:hypothetical protein